MSGPFCRANFALSSTNPAGTLLENYAAQGSDVGTWAKSANSAYSAGSAHLTGAGKFAANTANNTLYVSTVPPPSADYQCSATFAYLSAINEQVGAVVRADPSADTSYRLLWISALNEFAIYKWVGGSAAAVGAVSVSLAAGATYTMTLTAQGTTISGTVTRASDGNFLDSSGTWQAAYAVAISAADSSISAAGRAGLSLYSFEAPSDTTGLVVGAVAAAAVTAPVAILPTDLFDNGFSNQVGPDGNGVSYYNCSPFAKLVCSTDATSLNLVVYSNEPTNNNPGLSNVALRLNGTDADTLPANTAGNNTLAINLAAYPAYVSGTNTVELIAGPQASSNSGAPGATIYGTFLQSIQFVGGTVATKQAPTVAANRVVVYGTSIDVGASATNASGNDAFGLLGWTNLLRNSRGNGSVLVEAYGSRSLYSDASTSGALAAMAARLASFNAPFYWVAMGTNDYGLAEWSAASFGTAYASLLDQLHAALPGAVIVCQTALVRQTETANAFGNTLGDYRDQIVAACATRAGFTRLVHGENIVPLSDIADAGVHPNTQGQALLAQAAASALGVSGVPVITSAATATATVGVAFSFQVTASGNPTSFAASGLPPGLSINLATGLISGTPQ